MKKSKLLVPIIGISSLAATVAPIALTSCSSIATPSEQDKNYLDTINSYLTYKDDLISPHKALTTLKNIGYDVLAYQLASSDLEFAFDSSVKRFIIMNGDKIVAKPDDYVMLSPTTVFKFVSTYDKDCKYGQYLLDDFVWKDESAQFDATGSIDVGNNTNIKNIRFEPRANGMTKYLVRTFSEYVGIHTGNNMVYHMGETNNLDVYGSKADNCKFIELGRTAYLYVENTTMSVMKMDKIDSAQIDLFEAGKNVKKGVTFLEDAITVYTGEQTSPEMTKTPSTPTYVDSLEKFNTAVSAGNKYIQLTGDITIDSAITASDNAIKIANTEVLIDLNNHNIVDNSGIAEAGSVFQINATSAETTVMLLNTNRSDSTKGFIELQNGHNIYVLGTENEDFDKGFIANLYLEGVNISYKAAGVKTGAIKLGARPDSQHAASSGWQWSKVFMYGGKITATTTDASVDAVGIFLNRDSFAQILYGSIYADTICARTDGDYLGSTIDIVNATLKMTSDGNSEAACVYLPRGKLNSTNATMEGKCCIFTMGGEINIAGGWFKSTGDTKDIGTTNGKETDGSVICMGVGSSWAYGKNPSLTVHDATMQSTKSYILQLYKNTTISQYFELDFYGGIYYYAVEPTRSGETDYTGVRVAADVGDYCRVNQYGGNWVQYKPEE